MRNLYNAEQLITYLKIKNGRGCIFVKRRIIPYVSFISGVSFINTCINTCICIEIILMYVTSFSNAVNTVLYAYPSVCFYFGIIGPVLDNMHMQKDWTPLISGGYFVPADYFEIRFIKRSGRVVPIHWSVYFAIIVQLATLFTVGMFSDVLGRAVCAVGASAAKYGNAKRRMHFSHRGIRMRHARLNSR